MAKIKLLEQTMDTVRAAYAKSGLKPGRFASKSKLRRGLERGCPLQAFGIVENIVWCDVVEESDEVKWAFVDGFEGAGFGHKLDMPGSPKQRAFQLGLQIRETFIAEGVKL